MKIFNHRNTEVHRHFFLATLTIFLILSTFYAQSAFSNRQSFGPVAIPIKQDSDASADRIALYQALLDLKNPWTVMCVAAHPDDEDGTSLIVMRHKYGAHTVSLFSTFGEGGQNAIGPELYEELGAIRARETMAAAEIQGSEPHFLGLKDFGFSKTRDEAFKFWGHEEALRRMVLEIRKLRPDVMITNHSTTSNDHGQHQATALMVVEAFDAAADPNKFPEQLKDGVTTWQVQRLFVRARGNQASNAQIVTIDPNEKDPVRGSVYAEEALRALQKHATQGPWPKTFAEYATRFRAFSGQNAPTGQLPMIRYVLVKSAKSAEPMPAQESHDFLDGLTAKINQEAGALILPASIEELSQNRAEALQLLLKVYSTGYSKREHAADTERGAMMRARLDRALALAAGFEVEAKPAMNNAVPGSTLQITTHVTNAGTQPITGVHCNSVTGSAAEVPANGSKVAAKGPDRLAAGARSDFSDSVQIPANAAINVPVAQHLYQPTGLGLRIDTRCSAQISTATFGVDLINRVDVVPAVEIKRVTPSLIALSPEKAKLTAERVDVSLEVTLINHQTTPYVGQLAALEGTFGNPINEMQIKLGAGQEQTVSFRVSGPGAHIKNDSISLLVDHEKTLTDVRMFSTGATVAPNLSVGYVRGFDFSLPNALKALGVESKELSVDEVKTADLSKYTSVIVDNRVYESKPELIAVNQKLLDYANAGGTLIVFYHKSDEWNPDPRRNRPQLAPYKLLLGNERVTDENAPITFIEPDHPLLNVPNKMGQDDFRDWIQERGLYYPREWDPQFHALLQSNDPGENPLKGGLLVADYGKGHYIYTSMVWYRELRGGIPGAYRMLANMISYGRAN
jgi:LmbE family N-acetylglucosaminyl deacetylase